VKFILALLAFASAALGQSAILSGKMGAVPEGTAPFFRHVWFDSLSGPPDTIYTDTMLILSGIAVLHASRDAESTLVLIQRWSPDQHWLQVRYFDLGAGESILVEWSQKFKAESAYHVVRESIVDSLPSLPAESSFVTWRFWILRRTPGGVEDGRRPAVGDVLQSTVLRRIPDGAVAFDAMGRQVLVAKPGVYFVRNHPAALPRKVLLIE